jgi:hypothetical protein
MTISGETISKQIYLPNLNAGLTYDLDTYAAFPYTINEVYQIQTSSGTVTAAVKINTTAVTGLGSISVSSTPQNVAATGANSVKVGDQVQLVLSSNSGATNINLTLAATRDAYYGGYINKLRNPAFDIWQRGASSISVSTSGAYVADGWIVVPTGATCTALQASDNRSGALALYGQKMVGAASVTDILVKQRIESAIAAGLAGQTVTFSAWVYNGTGGSITPQISTKYAGSADVWTSPTTDLSATNLQACANSAWTQIAYTFAVSSSATNGYEVTIDFGNNFSSTSKYVILAEADFRVTPNVPTGLNSAPPAPELRPIAPELAFCERYFAKTFPQGTVPAQNSGVESDLEIIAPVTNQTATCTWSFPVTMRAKPSVANITTYAPDAASANWSTNGNTPTASVSRISDAGICIRATTALTAGAAYYIHATASAEL